MKTKICLCVFSLILALSGIAIAENPYRWYDDSYIQSHVSLSLPASDMDFIAKQIKDVQIDAVQFHTHDLALWDAINKQNLSEKLGFKKVATINYAGTWYPGYDRDSEKYIYRINSDGTFAGRWNRKHLCFNAPVVYEKIIPEKYTLLPKRIKPAQVWVDECIITVNVCYCKYCTALYEERYKIAPPRKLTENNWEQWEQWIKFHRDSFDNWMIKVSEAVHTVDPNILVTFNHAYFVEQPETPPSFIKNLSGDIFNDNLELGIYARYGGSQDLPFDLMPGLGRDIWAGVLPKTQSQIYTDIALIIAHGGKWNIGEFPTNFTKLRTEKKYQGEGFRRADIYFDLAKKGAEFARERKEFCRNTKSLPYVALLHSARTHYSHVIVNTNTINEDDNYGKTSDGNITMNTLGRINSRIFWPNNKPIYNNLVGAYESLIENHIHFDFINEDQLQSQLEKYKLLVLAEQTYLEDATIKRIKAFVANGGTVLATGSSIMADMEDVLGLSIASNAPLKNIKANINNEKVVFEQAWRVKAANAKVLADFDDSNLPMLTVNNYKKGKSIYIAGDIFKEYFDRSGYSYTPRGNNKAIRDYVNSLYNDLLPRDGIKIQADPWYEFTIRKNDKNDIYVHIINRTINWKQGFDNANENIKIILPLNTQPRSVTLQPDNTKLDFKYSDNAVTIYLASSTVKFYKIIKIEG